MTGTVITEIRRTLEGARALVNAGAANLNTAKAVVVRDKSGNVSGYVMRLTTGQNEILVADKKSGKIKIYAQLDDFVNEAAKLKLTSLGLENITIENPEEFEVVDSASGDQNAKAIKRREKLEKRKLEVVAAISEVDAALATLPHATAAEQLLVDEYQKRKEALLSSLDYCISGIAAITATLH